VISDVRGSDTIRTVVAVAGALALAGVLGTVGWLVVRPVPSQGRPSAADLSAHAAAGSSSTATTTSAVMARSGPATRASARPTPSRRPPAWQLPPAPAPHASTAGRTTCTRRAGADASAGPDAGEPADVPRQQVKTALAWAAARQYWRGTTAPVDLAGPVPMVTVPVNLIDAIAWQESGWRAVGAGCGRVGAVGVMGLSPAMAAWLNQRFATSYDVTTLSGNSALGAEYVEWLTVYFGLYYFGSYDLDTTADIGVGGAPVSLLDVVIASYDVGPAQLEHDNGTPGILRDDWLAIPDQAYVDSVVGLMADCVCLTY
jgi:hypothetical protein